MINNPVLRKELFLRLRFRQIPPPTRLGIFFAIALVMGIIYYEVIGLAILISPDPSTGADVWRKIVYIQFALICLIAPVVAANSITQEKEQQTWEMLIFTRLLPGEIIFGKLIARLSMLAVVIVLCFPIELFAWIHASHQPGSTAYISLGTVLLTYLTMLIVAIFFAAFGLYMSWLMKRTIFAIMLSYSFVVGGLIIVSFLVTAMMTFAATQDILYKCPLMWVNPIMMIAEATEGTSLDPNATLFLIYGLLVYVMVTLLMLWRMTVGFRRFAYEN